MEIVVLKFTNRESTKVIMHQTDNANDLIEFVRNNEEVKEFYKQTPKTERVFVKVMIYTFEYNERNGKLELKERVLGEFVTPSTSEKSVWKTDIEAKFPIEDN